MHARNGYALLGDLDDPEARDVLREMEEFQAEFLALTRPVWEPAFPIPGDALAHFSRQWEYPYAWTNLAATRGRFLDAGSGITFFPFLMSAAGCEVDCCDGDGSLELGRRFAEASSLTGCAVRFSECSLTELPYPDAAFDAACCLSVLEHTGPAAPGIARSLARVLRPGGRLVVTCDIDLGRTGALLLEDFCVLLVELRAWFEPVYPFDLERPRGLLMSDAFLGSGSWRLPATWRPPGRAGAGRAEDSPGPEFRSLAIFGATLERLGPRRHLA